MYVRGVFKSFVNGTRKWCLRVPEQGSTVDFFLFPRLKSIMKGARFADMAVIQERDSGSVIDS
jgi:hypothetical protein